jgi:hypothetical protein
MGIQIGKTVSPVTLLPFPSPTFLTLFHFLTFFKILKIASLEGKENTSSRNEREKRSA